MSEQNNSIAYPAKIAEQPEGGYSVTFRDIPEAITQGDSFHEAKQMGGFALLNAFDFYEEDQREIPSPSPTQDNEVLIYVALVQ